MIENTIPIINVSDLAKSLEFYESKLGFSKDWEAKSDSDKIAGISKDGCEIYLCEGTQGARGSWIWIGVENETYIDQVLKSGAEVLQEPTNYSWAYELRVYDPDGNVVRIGTAPRST
jgi:predicted lactoylglutathione lyase